MESQVTTDNRGFLVINLPGTELSEEDRSILSNPAVAGVLFFSRNFIDRQQMIKLVTDIRSVRPELLLMVDHEGGRVQRFKKDFTVLPPAASYVRYFNRDPDGALQLVKDSGWLMAQELLSCDIDLSLAPVLDINLGMTDIVGDRAFGSDAETVIKLATAWIEGVTEAGMACVGKHFPGHGSVNDDSHLTLPVDQRSLEEIEERDLVPFKALIEKGLQAIMPAHIVFPEVDDQPAGFSSVWLKDILRAQLCFNGVVISDCLTMAGAASAGGYPERVKMALNAGCDLLLLSNREGVKEVLAGLGSVSSQSTGITALRKKDSLSYDDLKSMNRYISCKDRLDHLAKRFIEE